MALLLVLSTAVTAVGARVPSDLKEAVAFFFAKNAKGDLAPLGTGFFVGVPDKVPDRGWAYLVTAKHILRGSDGLYLPRIWLRLNKKAGGYLTIEVPLRETGEKSVYVHPDRDVDLAVIPVQIPAELDVIVLPVSALTTKDDFSNLQIGEGTDVFFTGLFVPYFGNDRNVPIFRFGRLALVSNEKIPIEENGRRVSLDLYLVECQSFGGNSGSPVFFYFGVDRTPGSIIIGTPDVRVAGVMKGSYQHMTPIQVVQNAPVPVAAQNMGIALVVPAFLVREVILGSELSNLRSRGTAR